VSEFYDEVCFTNPSEAFYSMITRDANKPAPPSPMQVSCIGGYSTPVVRQKKLPLVSANTWSPPQEYFTVFSEARDLQTLVAAQHLVSAELNSKSSFCDCTSALCRVL
jgi:hypothetical protein